MTDIIILGIALVVVIAAFAISMSMPYGTPPGEHEASQERIKQEKEKKRSQFRSAYADEIDALFKEYPEIEWWEGSDFGLITISVKNRGVHFGRLEKDEHGNIFAWTSVDGLMRFERITFTLEEKVKVDKIANMLKDNDKIRKYCDLVAEQLLDTNTQAFNAPEGLGFDQKRFDAEYYDDSWIDAWSTALLNEFSAKRVEYKGEGIFLLEAI